MSPMDADERLQRDAEDSTNALTRFLIHDNDGGDHENHLRALLKSRVRTTAARYRPASTAQQPPRESTQCTTH
ncbi:unnamed protein product [Zymoseptoria tritici ST99CH_1E4]|uniref:Uncharacterized protein n=1 Tax=Zymoseptoria tritici ST99CH_1E4 TaxID=1276532 RepID=A0A2H1H3M1_ZYMTR|nr:unnamed protein product [Zymoseptoria tritici ST99CH_1E4]